MKFLIIMCFMLISPISKAGPGWIGSNSKAMSMAKNKVGSFFMSSDGSESGGRSIHGGEGGVDGKISGGTDSGDYSLVRRTFGGGEGGDD
jgi:hypothetical protein